MNKEDYVSLEVAKMLKERGFDEQCRYTYCGEDDENIGVSNNKNSNYPPDVYSMPTLYEAQKWLRERGYYVEVGIYDKYEWSYVIYGYDEEMCITMKIWEGEKFRTYEEALNAGIIEALKLI